MLCGAAIRAPQSGAVDHDAYSETVGLIPAWITSGGWFAAHLATVKKRAAAVKEYPFVGGWYARVEEIPGNERLVDVAKYAERPGPERATNSKRVH